MLLTSGTLLEALRVYGAAGVSTSPPALAADSRGFALITIYLITIIYYI